MKVLLMRFVPEMHICKVRSVVELTARRAFTLFLIHSFSKSNGFDLAEQCINIDHNCA